MPGTHRPEIGVGCPSDESFVEPERGSADTTLASSHALVAASSHALVAHDALEAHEGTPTDNGSATDSLTAEAPAVNDALEARAELGESTNVSLTRRAPGVLTPSDITSTSTEVSKPCACSGNCGWVLCTRALNQRRSQKKTLRKLGHRFCSWCECESEGCGRPRSREHSSKRWCSACAPDRVRKRQQYATAHGVWPLSSLGSDASLKFLAKIGFLTNRMLPNDTRAVLDLMQSGNPFQGQDIKAIHIVLWFLAQAIKWPPVVQEFSRQLATRNIDELRDQDLLHILKELIAWAAD